MFSFSVLAIISIIIYSQGGHELYATALMLAGAILYHADTNLAALRDFKKNDIETDQVDIERK